MGKQVEVTVAARRSIHLNGVNGKPATIKGPGEKVVVDESEVERLVKQKFIVDPHAKKVVVGETDVDMSGYLPNEKGVLISEDSAQSIKKGG